MQQQPNPPTYDDSVYASEGERRAFLDMLTPRIFGETFLFVFDPARGKYLLCVTTEYSDTLPFQAHVMTYN